MRYEKISNKINSRIKAKDSNTYTDHTKLVIKLTKKKE